MAEWSSFIFEGPGRVASTTNLEHSLGIIHACPCIILMALEKYLLADATDESDLPMVGILGRHPQVDISCITECISSSLNVVQ